VPALTVTTKRGPLEMLRPSLLLLLLLLRCCGNGGGG